MTEHVLMGIGTEATAVATCRCGWRSVPALSIEQAEARWRIHVVERRAARWTREAQSLQQRTKRRADEMLELRAVGRARRRQLQVQRRRLRAATDQLRLTAHHAHAPAPGPALDQARLMAGVSIFDLWFDYFAVGGDAPIDELIAMLGDRTPIGEADYDRIAVVLNERYADAGFGRPLDLWSELEDDVLHRSSRRSAS
jgi:hypothetical protein